MNQLGHLLQESVCSEARDLNHNSSRRSSSTIMGLLRERLEGAPLVQIRRSSGNDGHQRRRLPKHRFGLLKGFGCCGATWWGHHEGAPEEEEEQEEDREASASALSAAASPGMNLAAALEAERQWREGVVASPMRVSLMRLLEETASFHDDVNNNNNNKDNRNNNTSSDRDEKGCCVCMGREKGAALIPCGHTFCRVCSRELWLNRGSCPLCNRSILDILDIY